MNKIRLIIAIWLPFLVYIFLSLGLFLVIIFIFSNRGIATNYFVYGSILSFIIPLVASLGLTMSRYWKNKVQIILAILVCQLTIFCTNIFGPVFLDRSISYHLVFYAVKNGKLVPEDFERRFSGYVFSKRVEDAVSVGLLKSGRGGGAGEEFHPTDKAKRFDCIFQALGRITGSLDNYKDMIKESERQK